MRLWPLLGILAAMPAITAGCGKNRSAWVGIDELKTPARPSVQAGRLDYAGSGISRDLRFGGWKSTAIQADSARTGKPATDEIARRIAERQKDWENYRAWQSARPRTHEPDPVGAASVEEPPPAAKYDSESLISLAVRRRHSTEYVNLRMRIAILEARLASAGESEQKTVAAKLEQAKSEMRAIDAASVKESSSSADAGTSAEGVKIEPAVRK